MAAPCARLQWVRGPVLSGGSGRPFNGIVRQHQSEQLASTGERMEIIGPNQVEKHQVTQHVVAGGACIYLSLTMKDGSLFQCDIPLSQAERLARDIARLTSEKKP